MVPAAHLLIDPESVPKDVSANSLPRPAAIWRRFEARAWYLRCPHSWASLRPACRQARSEEHTSELQSREKLVCRLLLEKKKRKTTGDHAYTNSRSRTPYA